MIKTGGKLFDEIIYFKILFFMKVIFPMATKKADKYAFFTPLFFGDYFLMIHKMK